jgi:hypothetical protein
MLGTVSEPARRLPLHRFDDRRMRVSEDERAPGQSIIEIAIAIHIIDFGGGTVIEK